MRHLRARLVVALAVVLPLLVAAPAVSAHALLARSDPADGSEVRSPPTRVVAWFSEPVEGGVSTLRVIDGRGVQVDGGHLEVGGADPSKVSVGVRDDLAPGFYTVTWETLSRIDGHLWFGSFTFTVLNAD